MNLLRGVSVWVTQDYGVLEPVTTEHPDGTSTTRYVEDGAPKDRGWRAYVSLPESATVELRPHARKLGKEGWVYDSDRSVWWTYADSSDPVAALREVSARLGGYLRAILPLKVMASVDSDTDGIML